ncbi:MAG: CoB--CoM heterodisulfide reductase iron-sulfur subunit B family protein [Nitrospirota bacterium]|nr:CoB--CoM heterodisulfide reductase iron-sulfur subunit B family protein [Nitrospirota bacterium]
MRYAFYPGCSALGTSPELYKSTIKVAKALDIQLDEMTDASCCGTSALKNLDPSLADAINTRTLAMAEQKGLDILTICGTCQGVLAHVNKRVSNDTEHLLNANRAIADSGLQYSGTVKVKHLLWALIADYGVDKLKEKLHHQLRGIKIAPFYGCHILRLSADLGFDDPENPTSLETLIEATGADVVRYKSRIKCCGFPVVLTDEPAALTMTSAALLDAKNNGADLVVTPCPLCHINLDSYQRQAEKHAGQEINLPVLHLSQMIGLALGMGAKELGIHQHFVPMPSI